MRLLGIAAPIAVLGFGAASAIVACSTGPKTSGFEPAAAADASTGTGDPVEVDPPVGEDDPVFVGDGGQVKDAKGPCQGLECQVNECTGKPKTTISGTVYDPSGKNPLYNVIVWIPRDPAGVLDPIAEGSTCDQCGATIKGAATTTLTNTKGEFKIEDAPVGVDIPLVMQIGKWRRKITIPKVNECAETVIGTRRDPAHKNEPEQLTRLPRTHLSAAKPNGEGNIPRIAAVTGACDPLPCIFRRIGVDSSEFTPRGLPPNLDGRVHVFGGAGFTSFNPAPLLNDSPAPNAQNNLWASKAALQKYDLVFLSCECDEYDSGTGANKTDANKAAMREYLNEGGRVFATHYHYAWFKENPNPDLQGVAVWAPSESATTTGPFTIDTTFPKGIAFRDWLQSTAGVTGSTMPLEEIRGNVYTVPAKTTRWVYKPQAGSVQESVKYLTFNTPVGAAPAQQCGRGVFSDIHVSNSTNNDTANIPSTCRSGDLSPQEKALEFLFFDLSACVQDDKLPPVPPPIPK